MLENTGRTEIKDLGEVGLIDLLTQHIKLNHLTTMKGVGDDAAVLDFTKGKTLVSTDLLLEGIHFDMMYTPLKHLGYKAVTVNLSDIAAMNATPTQITVSMGLSNRFSVEAVEEFYQGVLLACKKYNIDLVGGDTTSSVNGLVISVTAMGVQDQKKIVYRKGMKDKDLICVSGDLGAAYLGLQILEREKQIFLENNKIQPDLGGNDYLLERILKPEARVDVVSQLEGLKIIPSSMIDISDGLASEVQHLCRESKVGAVIYEEKLPIDHTVISKAMEFNLDPTICAINGGEDYELLFSISQADYKKIENHPDITIIGYATDASEGVNLVTKAGNSHPLKGIGWDSFKNED
ncbi:MAG: thiamine-monophosphate kinase [Sphingobacteriales bacterium]|jgi:thiamine-monophosphate kinase